MDWCRSNPTMGSVCISDRQASSSYLNETRTLALYEITAPSSICMSSLETSAILRSLKCSPALATATLAAFSHDSDEVPTNSMTL